MMKSKETIYLIWYLVFFDVRWKISASQVRWLNSMKIIEFSDLAGRVDEI